MKLTDDDIQEFIKVWKKEFGETLSPRDARDHAVQLLTLYRDVVRSMAATRRQINPNEPPSM